jgi:cytochrome c oxidase subunit 2
MFMSLMLKARAITGTSMRIVRAASERPQPQPKPRAQSSQRAVLGVLWILALAACSGPQSALDPAGEGAARIADLFWMMLGGAALIWILVIGAAVYATRIRPGRHSERVASALLWGGLVVPTAVLAGLLTWGLALMADLRVPGDGLEIAVSGEQWWWRVDYRMPGGEVPVASANEVRLPRGRRVEFELTSPDVIHAFWIPSIAGKVDNDPRPGQSPGRRTDAHR